MSGTLDKNHKNIFVHFEISTFIKTQNIVSIRFPEGTDKITTPKYCRFIHSFLKIRDPCANSLT